MSSRPNDGDKQSSSSAQSTDNGKPRSLTEEASQRSLAQSAAGTNGLTETSKDTKESKDGKKVATTKKEEKKLTIGQKIMREVHHYWDGTKLLAVEIKISTKLAFKMAAGYELSRRENRQLQRTVQDLGRLVPFSVFVIVPFAELLLPIALKLFPNLLPSTYEGQTAKDARAGKLRSTRTEVSTFLRDSLQESGLPISKVNMQSDEFKAFFKKIRRGGGESPSEAEVIKISRSFKDDMTLDNMSRPQLVSTCRYMCLGTFGTDGYLRYTIRHRMRQIKRDDRAIADEGVDSLSVPELQTACASRGLRTHGISPAHLRDDLQMWLDLRLRHGIPSTLLIMTNAFMYAEGKDHEFGTQIGALKAVLSSIPEELFHEMELEVHSAEGAATNRQRLEVLKEQEELIEDENEQQAEEGAEEGARMAPRDDQNIDDDEVEQRRLDATEREGVSEGQATEALAAERDGFVGEELQKGTGEEGVKGQQEQKEPEDGLKARMVEVKEQ